jgi:ABC-2 type transport system ATP-binding protein
MLITENLTKRYKDFTAVDNLCLEVKEGSIFGFLGHNGAGENDYAFHAYNLAFANIGMRRL